MTSQRLLALAVVLIATAMQDAAAVQRDRDIHDARKTVDYSK